MNRTWRHTFPLTALFPSAIPVGSQRVRAICPDPKHAETHPSCIVNYNSTHGWKWHCFSCGADGDALDVLTGREGMSFREAMGVLTGASSERGSQMAVIERGAEPSPPAGNALRHDALVLICDVCLSETHEVSKRAYRLLRTAKSTSEIRLHGESRRDVSMLEGQSALYWTASADLELATLPGWELSAGLQFAIGPKCLERIGA